MDTQKLQDLIDWLTDGARSAPTPPKFMKETCERLVDCGVQRVLGLRDEVSADAAVH